MKTVKNIASQSYEGKQNKLNLGLVATGAFFSTLMVASSVVQATDLQIYAAPTAGKKTIVMMLDTSGSMGYGFGYYDRYNNPYTSMSIQADYGVCSGTNVINAGALTDNKLYKISSTTSPSYERYFCYVSKKNANIVPEKVKDTKTGCEKQNVDGTIYRCYDRMTRLKDGMFSFLDSTNPELNKVKVGLGSYSVDIDGDGVADSTTGSIKVPAKALEGVDSLHRVALKTAVKNLVAWNGTPTAHAYAEAASYLMGSNTLQSIELKNAPVYFSDSPGYYKECVNWNSNGTDCTSWSRWINKQLTNGDVSGLTSSFCRVSKDEGTCYKKTGTLLISNSDSGFNQSNDTTKNDNQTAYVSPLPEEKNRQSCDGQGVFILSDGAANSTSEARASAVMTSALGDFGNNFSCGGGLSEAYEGQNPGGWRCMGELAKKLYNKSTNPAGVSIQTAFVGFGREMSDLDQGYVENACRLGSRTQDERTSDDHCSPTATNYKTDKPGYGNGGFFIASRAQDITNSVIQFIDNIGKNIIDPLSTGAISVPVDALSPHTFQPYGYLRAMEPKPGTQNIIWMGNLKKYAIQNGALKSGSLSVFNNDGTFQKGTKDFWNTTAKTDDAGIEVGGAFSNLILPTVSSPKGYRPLFSDIGSVSSTGVIVGTAKNADLFFVSKGAVNSDSLLSNFKTDGVLKNLTVDIKLKLLNYFGYALPLSPAVMPETLQAPAAAASAMGASIHSFPVQMTYSGELDANGDLKTARKQSVLYGSMEGALRVVDAASGAEQMVFVPSEILTDETASKALVKGESNLNGVVAGIGGAWIVDSDYQVTSESADTTSVSARKMNVYGGMRMGGKSYYGLDMLQPAAPKFLFKVAGGTGDFSRMGQTWSKPVLANIRYNNKITRVMIVGGGYDMCYENPRFTLNTVNPAEYGGGCKKAEAEGNAVYIINADTGERIWWASNKDANINNTDMKHSIVSRIATLDRDGDGLVDNLYFGDLGGQIFRADLNNAKGAVLGKRVVRLANLAANTDGTAITNGDQPRFYQPPTLTVHDEGEDTFLLVGIASGDRSTPLDVAPEQGREKMLPYTALTNRPTNKVYGLIDRDVANKYLMTGQTISGELKDISLVSENIGLADLKANPQLLTGKVAGQFSSTGWKGWYRSLSSGPDGIEIKTATMTNSEGVQVTTTRTPGGLKAFEEEPIAMTGRLLIPVYDPQGTGIVDRSNPCQPRIVGETNVQQFCLPYGACLKITGDVDKGKDSLTGFQMEAGRNKNVLGAGIRGLSMGPTDPDNTDPNKKGVNCGALTILGLQSGKGKWECNKILNPTRWYEKYVEAKNN